MKRCHLLPFVLALASVVRAAVLAPPLAQTPDTSWSAGYSLRWASAGVPGVPQGEIPNTYTQYGSTITSTGDSTDRKAEIQAAINAARAAGSNYYVKLGPGTFYFSGTITVRNCVLRGSGMDQTTLYFTPAYEQNGIHVGYGDASWGTVSIANVTSGLTKGSTSVTVDAPSNLNTGRIALFSFAADGALPATTMYFTDIARIMCVLVTGISGSTVTFTPPLPFTPTGATIRTSNEGAEFTGTHYTGTGVEDLTVEAINTSVMQNGIAMTLCDSSWLKGVKVIKQKNFAFNVSNCTRSTITRCYATAGAIGPNHGGFQPGVNSECLFIHNIAVDNQPNWEVNGGNASCVFAFNASPTERSFGVVTNHGAHNSFNLYEGNVFSSIISDGYHGSESDLTIFNNRLTNSADGLLPSEYAVKGCRFLRRLWFVGNACELPGFTYANNGIKLEGWPNLGNWQNKGDCDQTLGTYPWDWDTTNNRPKAWTGTLSSRTDNTHGQVTMPSGVGAQIQTHLSKSYGGLIGLIRQGGFGPATVSGDVVTIEITDGNTSLPASVGDSVTFYPSHDGFQELDGAVLNTSIHKGNTTVYDGGIAPGETIGTDTLPSSLFMTSKPTAFGSLAWPVSYSIADSLNTSLEKIPAGYFYIHGVWPDEVGSGSSQPHYRPRGSRVMRR